MYIYLCGISYFTSLDFVAKFVIVRVYIYYFYNSSLAEQSLLGVYSIEIVPRFQLARQRL